jgi:hypothetical protein
MRFMTYYHRFAEEIEHVAFNILLKTKGGQPTNELDHQYLELLQKMRTWENQVAVHKKLFSDLAKKEDLSWILK